MTIVNDVIHKFLLFWDIVNDSYVMSPRLTCYLSQQSDTFFLLLVMSSLAWGSNYLINDDTREQFRMKLNFMRSWSIVASRSIIFSIPALAKITIL